MWINFGTVKTHTTWEAILSQEVMQGKLQIAAITSLAVLLRCCVTYHSHSGEGKPPIYGDYEAQRHWQEITFNLPFDEWYTNTTDNDLLYWGLDYPPLTAYHSLLLGHVANRIDPSYVKLHESRGLETAEHKHFMRLTVLLADILIYVPAVVYFVVNLYSCGSCQVNECNAFKLKRRDAVLLTALIYPGLILIDHGHFQYNCVSLGLFVAAVTAIIRDSFVFGSILFVLALNYKQMELYHALPFFFYILGYYTAGRKKSWFYCTYKLTYISLTVLSTFFIIWMPFLKDRDLLISAVLRLFPFVRGVFEDKVANVWCAINVIYKLREIFTNAELAKICLVITTCAALPSCINLYLLPRKDTFIVSLINSSLAFFLFSFQVHEKSILLVAVPVLLHFQNDPLPCFWFLITSHFSMLPLFIKDELYLTYFVTMVFYFLSVSLIWPGIFYNNETSSSLSRDNSESRIKEREAQQYKENQYFSGFLDYSTRFYLLVAFYIFVFGMLLLSIAIKYIKPPAKYPDLFPLLISVYSCGHFLMFFIYFNYVQLFALRKRFAEKVKSL